MLDEESNDTQIQNPPAPADTAQANTEASTDTPAKPARKRTASKRTAKKTAPAPDAPDAAPPVQTATAATAPEIAPVEAAPAKTTARKRTSKKAAASQAEATQPEAKADQPPAGGPQAETPADAPAKKTARKRTSKKAAASQAEATQADQDQQGEPDEKPARRTRKAAATAAVLFQAPEPVTEPERPARRRTAKKAAAEDETAADRAQAKAETPKAESAKPEAGKTETAKSETEGEAPARSRRSRQRRTQDAEAEAPKTEVEAEPESEDTDAEEGAETESGEGPRRRRRRRGGRRRRKSGEAGAEDGSEDEGSDEGSDDSAEADQADGDEETDGEGGTGSRRRRRRRRRKGEDGAAAADDPDEVVVRVREPRSSKAAASEITAVEGSTRLEAKKQRRREGRAAGRRRAPIVTEAEFLARRESVERTMVIRTREDLTQIAVSEDNVLVEHYVAQEEQVSLIGNVYLGRVQNVLPSMEAAFIDIGKGRNAVLYAGEVDWATLGGGNGPRKIESVLKSGQPVLVQVTKDPVGHKGARLTNQISLPGRYVVYVPRGGNGGISRKLPDTERNRLKGILKDVVPDEAGVIVRTAAEGASEEELTRDVSRLKSYWEDIDKKSSGGQAPQLLYGEPDLLIRVVRDLFTEDFTKLVISGDDAFDLVNEYVSYVAPHLADRVEKWTGDGDVFSNFRIDEQIKKALDRKVWLPSGGSLVIDRTEAMTVVDVNTGKFTGSGGNLEETVTRNNLEAAEEIVRQLRLRDIGGIIVIDFIDMVLESNRDLVLRRLVECLGRDRTKHQVAEVTSLGLVQMTRKRIGTGLLEAFSETCDHCGGRGLILHDEPREPKKRADDSRRGSDRGRDKDGSKDGKQDGKAKSSRGGRGRGRKQAEDQPADKPQEQPDKQDKPAAQADVQPKTELPKAEEPKAPEPKESKPEQSQPEQPKAEQDGKAAADQSDWAVAPV
jgi:ribonuclease E